MSAHPRRRGAWGALREAHRRRSYRFRNLRSRLTLLVMAVLAAVLLVGGSVLARESDRAERDSLDDRLRRTAGLLDRQAIRAVEEGGAESDPQLDQVLNATDSSLVVGFDGLELLQAGRVRQQPGTEPIGFSTRTVRGRPVRVLSQALAGDELYRIEVATSLRQVDRRREALRERLLLLGLAILVVAGVGTWIAADLVLRPLRRLRREAGSIEGDEDLERRVPVEGATEVRALAGSFNAMLERLGRSAAERERALAATRRFAADVGHELRTPLSSVQAALSLVHRHPDADPATRSAVVGDALTEQRRVVALLDGLQALARGDSVAEARADVDLRDVVADASDAVAARHPRATIRTDLGERPVVVHGWEPGLRSLVENLVCNAAIHGRPAGEVLVALAAAGRDTGPRLVVSDDGEGIAAADRPRVFEPFVRAGAGDRPGSGLGLAVVAQQLAHHGAQVDVDDGPAGGARFTVRFPVGPGGA